MPTSLRLEPTAGYRAHAGALPLFDFGEPETPQFECPLDRRLGHGVHLLRWLGFDCRHLLWDPTTPVVPSLLSDLTIPISVGPPFDARAQDIPLGVCRAENEAMRQAAPGAHHEIARNATPPVPSVCTPQMLEPF